MRIGHHPVDRDLADSWGARPSAMSQGPPSRPGSNPTSSVATRWSCSWKIVRVHDRGGFPTPVARDLTAERGRQFGGPGVTKVTRVSRDDVNLGACVVDEGRHLSADPLPKPEQQADQCDRQRTPAKRQPQLQRLVQQLPPCQRNGRRRAAPRECTSSGHSPTLPRASAAGESGVATGSGRRTTYFTAASLRPTADTPRAERYVQTNTERSRDEALAPHG